MSSQPIAGLESVLSRISQIQDYQQQLLDPTTATSAGASTAATTDTGATTSTGTTGSSGTDFAALLAQLQSADASGSDASSSSALSALTGSSDSGGLTGSSDASLLSSLTGSGESSDLSSPSALSTLAGLAAAAGTSTLTTNAVSGGAGLLGTSATGAVPAQVQAMTTEANALVGRPYVWGGGHDGWGTQSGYDCSGFVSAVLHAGGYLASPQDTQTLPGAAGIASGPGQYVTIYDRTDAGTGSDHVIINIGGQFYESGGEAGAWGGGGGVERIATPSAAYLSTFNRILHPAGL